MALLALATIYYGGTAYSNYKASAEASTLTNQASQLYAASLIYKQSVGTWPATPNVLLNTLPDGSQPLNALPVPPQGTLAMNFVREAIAQTAKEWEFVMDGNQVLTFIALKEAVKPETCLQVKLKAEGNDSLLSKTYTEAVADIKANLQTRITAGTIKPEDYGFQRVGDNDWVLNETEKARLATLAVIPNKIDPGKVYQCVDEVFINTEAPANQAYTYFWKAPSGGDTCVAVTAYNGGNGTALGCGSSVATGPVVEPPCTSGIRDINNKCVPEAFLPTGGSQLAGDSLVVTPGFINFGEIAYGVDQYQSIILTNTGVTPILIISSSSIYGEELGIDYYRGTRLDPAPFSMDDCFPRTTAGGLGFQAYVLEAGKSCPVDINLFIPERSTSASMQIVYSGNTQLRINYYIATVSSVSAITGWSDVSAEQLFVPVQYRVPVTARGPSGPVAGDLVADKACYHNGFASGVICTMAGRPTPADPLWNNPKGSKITLTVATAGMNLTAGVQATITPLQAPGSALTVPTVCTEFSCSLGVDGAPYSGAINWWDRTEFGTIMWYYGKYYYMVPDTNNRMPWKLEIKDGAGTVLGTYSSYVLGLSGAGYMLNRADYKIAKGYSSPISITQNGAPRSGFAASYGLVEASSYGIAYSRSEDYPDFSYTRSQIEVAPTTSVNMGSYFDLTYTIPLSVLNTVYSGSLKNSSGDSVYQLYYGVQNLQEERAGFSGAIQTGGITIVNGPARNRVAQGLACITPDTTLVQDNKILVTPSPELTGGGTFIGDYSTVGGAYLENSSTKAMVPAQTSYIGGDIEINIPAWLEAGTWNIWLINNYGGFSNSKSTPAITVLTPSEVLSLNTSYCSGGPTTTEQVVAQATSTSMAGCTSLGIDYTSGVTGSTTEGYVVKYDNKYYSCPQPPAGNGTAVTPVPSAFSYIAYDRCASSGVASGCGYGQTQTNICEFLSTNVKGRASFEMTNMQSAGLYAELSAISNYGRSGVGGYPGGPSGLCRTGVEAYKTQCRAVGTVSGYTMPAPILVSCTHPG